MMKQNKNKLVLVITAVLLFIFAATSYARDWDDLEKGNKKVYGSEKEDKFPVNAFFVEKEDWKDHYSCMAFFLFRYTNYPKFKSLRILPFYYNLKSKIDNREKTILPLFLYYNRIDGKEDLTVSPLYFSNIDGKEAHRSLFYLFWWGKDRGGTHHSSYQFLLPFLFYHSYETNIVSKHEESFVFWFPFFIRSWEKYTNYQKRKTISHTNFSFLHFYTTEYDTQTPHKDRTTWFFPIIPLTYHYTTPTYGHRNIAWILDWSYNKNKDTGAISMKRFWFFPLLLWKKQTYSGYLHILPPIFISTNYKNGEYYRHFLPPLYISWRSTEYGYDYKAKKRNDTYTDNLISLFYCFFDDYKEGKWTGKKYSSTFWFPLIPLFYRSQHPSKGTHYNLAWILDWHFSKKGNLDRFWFMPLYFGGGDNSDGYRHILPPLFVKSWDKSGESYTHLLPLYFGWKSIKRHYAYKERKYKNDYINVDLSLFFVSYKRHQGEKKWDSEVYKSTFWFPIVPLFYRSYHKHEGTHYNLAWLIDWKFNTKGDLSRFWLMPLYFGGGDDSDGYRHFLPPLFVKTWDKSGESYAHLLPVYFGWKTTNRYYSYATKKYENEYEDNDLSLFFVSFDTYRGNNKWKSNLHSSSFWFPIIPLFYKSYSKKEGTHYNLAWLIDWKFNRHGSLERFWFMPFYFGGGSSSDGYAHFLPPVFIKLWDKSGESYAHFLPLYMGWKDSSSYYDQTAKKYKDEYEDVDISLLYSSVDTFRGDRKWNSPLYSTTYWFPIIPLFFRSVHPVEGNHTNIAWIFDWHTTPKGTLDRLWITPLYFSKDYNDNDGYRFILPPVFMSFWDNTGENYWHVLPLLFKWKSISGYYVTKDGKELSQEDMYYTSNADKSIKHKTEYNDSFFSLFGCYFNTYRNEGKKWDGQAYSSTFWFPLVPLYFSSYQENKGTHRNLLWVFDWHKDDLGKLTRFWAFPFVFHKPGVSNYTYIFPFYMHPAGGSEQQGYHWGLFHYHSWSKKRDITWSWLYYSRDNKTNERYYTHFLPVYYSWKGKKSTGRVVLPLWITYEDKNTSLHINIAGLSKSIAIGPFGAGVGLGAGTHKGDWYLDTDISWLYDIFSISTRVTIPNPFKKKELHDDDVKLSDALSNLDKGTTTEKDSTTEDKTNKKLVENNKPNSDKKGQGKELVSDTSKNKKKTKNTGNTENKTATDSLANNNKKTEKLITKKKSFSREDSRHFFGLNILFGWFSFEVAKIDDNVKKHIRLLPLCWLTWDEKNKDKVYVIPLPVPIVRYMSVEDDSEYTVVFPFYGHQRIDKSYRYAFLGNLFWKEYDQEEKLHEYTALWPIFNLYSSPQKFGWRIFPVIWYKYGLNNNIRSRSFFSPVILSYGHWKHNIQTGKLVRKTVINPLWYATKRTGKTRFTETNFAPIIPLYYSTSETRTVFSEPVHVSKNKPIKSVPDNPDRYSKTDTPVVPIDTDPRSTKDRASAPEQKDKLANNTQPKDEVKKSTVQSVKKIKTGYVTDSFSYIFPLGLRSTTETGTEGGTKTVESTVLGLPLLYYSYDDTYAKDTDSGTMKQTSSSYSLFLLGFYRHASDTRTTNSFLFGLVSSTSYLTTGKSEFKLLYGLLSFYGSKSKSESWFFPLWYYHNSPRDKEFSLLVGLFKTAKTTDEHFSSVKLLWGLFRTSGWTEKRNIYDFSTPFDATIKRRRTWLFPLFYYSSGSGTQNYSEISHTSLLHHYSHETAVIKGTREYSTSFWFPIVPLFFYHGERDNSRLKKYSGLIPLFYYNSRTNIKENITEKYLLSPLCYYSSLQSGTSSESTFWFPIIPLFYRHSSPAYTHTNILGIFNWKSSNNKSEDSRYFLLPLVYRSSGSWGSHTNILGVMDFGWNSKGNLERNFLLPVYMWFPGKRYSKLIIFPLLTYMETTPLDSTKFIAGLYLYDSKSYNRQNFLYLFDRRHYIDEQRRDYNLLLGTINYEISPQIRKWRLFYGLLASYKSELNTPNYDFSILQFVFTFKRQGDYFRHSFLPFYYYSENKNSWSMLSPVTLTYLSKDADGDFDMVLLGLLYYRNNKINERYDRRNVLLGTLWNEVKRPERGYHSRGMLWGLLWEYETENTRGFEKFSILKGLYKSVSLDGKTRRTILWVF